MATFTLGSTQKFPAGTSVGAYPRSNWLGILQDSPSGGPPGSATATATTAADGTTAFTGLVDNTRYWAYAQVSGEDRYVAFTTAPSATPRDELAYSEKTDASQVVTTAGRVDITNLSVITFDVVAGQIVWVELFVPWHTAANAGASLSLNISDNAGADALANVKRTANGPACYQTAATRLGALRVAERIATPGTYSRKGQATATGNSITLTVAAPTTTIELRATTFR